MEIMTPSEASTGEEKRKAQWLGFIAIGITTVLIFVFVYYNAENEYASHPAPIRPPEAAKPQPVVGGAPRPPPDAVVQNGWDGSIYQVERWLKQNANDPHSLEFIEWSNLKKSDLGYAVRCKYRAKNGLGAFVIENKLFYLNFAGDVIGNEDVGN